MPATCASQVLVVLACLPFVELGSASGSDWGILAALGVGQMGVGLALLTIGARLIPPAQVAVISLLEVVLGPLWVWLAYGERAAFRVGRAVAGWLVAPLRLALRLPQPPHRPRLRPRRDFGARRARRLLLVHAITSRGPPLGIAVV